MRFRPAPKWSISHWLNTDAPISLADLRGRVVFLEAFQMLCPGCVSHGLPQAKRVAATFPSNEVALIGLHTVFEHHEAQGGIAPLKAFLHENQISFPVGLDVSKPGQLPETMSSYGMQGTPTTVLIDRTGHVRQQRLGMEPDMQLGRALATLVAES